MLSLKKKKQIFLDIIVILCWMGIVFTFSSQVGKVSTNLSGSISEKIVEFVHRGEELTKKEKTALVKKYNHVIRKMAHYTIYLIGGIAIIVLINDITDKRWLSVTITTLIGFLYASSDEIHQYFVAGRDARFTDVLIDTAGVITGILLYLIFIKVVNKIRKNKNKQNSESI